MQSYYGKEVVINISILKETAKLSLYIPRTRTLSHQGRGGFSILPSLDGRG